MMCMLCHGDSGLFVRTLKAIHHGLARTAFLRGVKALQLLIYLI
jgi:hypothetical protein